MMIWIITLELYKKTNVEKGCDFMEWPTGKKLYTISYVYKDDILKKGEIECRSVSRLIDEITRLKDFSKVYTESISVDTVDL